MYELEKLKNEEIMFISDNTFLKMDDYEKNVSTIITNQRFLLLDYPSDINNYQEILRLASGANYIKYKELILDVFLDDIVDINVEEKYDKYILSNTNYFYLKDDKVKEFMSRIV